MARRTSREPFTRTAVRWEPEEVRAAKEALGWPVEPPFLVPDEALAHFRAAVERGSQQEKEWHDRVAAYEVAFPETARELARRFRDELPAGWETGLSSFPADPKGVATRKASEIVLQSLASKIPELMGGSADLDPSTFTWLKEQGDFEAPARPRTDGAQGAVGGVWGFAGRNLHFGVREHAMGAAVNGLMYHGGFIAYGSTFLVFSDYMRPAVRLSALARLGSVWVYTHDSIGVGEDGPTHQPIEHYLALRAIPDLLFIRPGDANETAWAWQVAIQNRHRPTVLALTRQAVPTLDRSVYASAEGLTRGAYVLNPEAPDPDVILIATGSELQHIVGALPVLAAKGIRVRPGLDAVLGAVRGADGRVPGQRPARVRAGSPGSGGGVLDRLAPVGRDARRRGLDRPFRSVGARRGLDEGIRIHVGSRRARCRRGPGAGEDPRLPERRGAKRDA